MSVELENLLNSIEEVELPNEDEHRATLAAW